MKQKTISNFADPDGRRIRAKEKRTMQKQSYISVILPLRLEWKPCYRTDNEELHPGSPIKVFFAGKEYTGIVSEVDIEPQTAPSEIREIIGKADEYQDVSEQEMKFWRQIAEYYMCTVGEVFKAAHPALKTGEASGKAKAGKIRKSSTKNRKVRKIELSPAQELAEKEIKAAFDKGNTVMLNGITGSGKTAVYIKLAEECLKTGKNVLYLVPEIAISRQLEDRLREYFGDSLYSFHSGKTPAQRKKVIAAVKEAGGTKETGEAGKPYIVLGTRSSLFIPHNKLGLIIVDEEHDSSYKQESPSPRYHGRDAAIMLAGIFSANILLGSATPSLEAILNCRSGKFTEVKLTERFHEAADSEVEIIDTIAEHKKRGMAGSFSRKLILKIEQTLSKGEQVMILRARRGYSPVVQCSECGFIPKCPHCNISLTYHKDKEKITCHHCGYSLKYNEKCPECGGIFRELGAGTQKIEEEAAKLFPQARTARLDSDTAQSPKYEKEVISRFENGELDILIGTQMVAKGFDFQKLSLVAIMQADTLMSTQDFRADERAIQTLEQFRGRCGRRENKGCFVIQTSQAGHPIYKSFKSDFPATDISTDYSSVLLQERKDFNYPPFTRLVNLTIKDNYEKRADRMAGELAAKLRDFQILGPYAPASGKLADRYIREISVILPKDRTLSEKKKRIQKMIREVENANHYSGHISIDVDPV